MEWGWCGMTMGLLEGNINGIHLVILFIFIFLCIAYNVHKHSI